MTAPAGALPVFPHCRCSECSPQERYPYFLTAPAVSAPAGALPKFPHCRSSARSSRKPFPPSPLLHPPPTPSISSLPQQCLLQQEPLPPSPLYFLTAAAVTAPAGALPVFPHCRCSECSPQERYPYFLTAPAVSAPAGALPKFPHCRSSARSSRKPFPPSPLLHPPHTPSISSLPQQCLLQQEPLPPSPLYFLTAAAVLAPAGASPPPLPFPTAPTPPWESPPPAVFFTTAVVPALAGTFSLFSPLPQ